MKKYYGLPSDDLNSILFDREMNTKKNRIKSFIGGIVIGSVVSGYVVYVLMANYILSIVK